jgi:uncharacterized protein YdhG (YjbR/CyaY superfamily)
VDTYIAGFDGIVRDRLEQVHSIIRAIIPAAEEKISYGVPAYWDEGYIIYFAGFPHHIGIYPIPSEVDPDLAKELDKYRSGKATVRFPHDQPLPDKLIEQIVKLRVEINKSHKQPEK